MEKYKIGILSVAEFLENRPNLYAHDENEIQSAIYQSASLLNGETAGLVQKVWDYVTSTNPDPNNELYRNATELSFLKEAFIVQTQFTLNNANSFVQGSNSFNATGFNLSSTSPVERDVLAPNVRTLLQQANMYVFQTLGSLKDETNNKCLVSDERDILTLNKADQLYVKQIQEHAAQGNVAVIDPDKPTKQIVFKEIGSLLTNTRLDATRVLDSDRNFRELASTRVVSDINTRVRNVADVSNANDVELGEQIRLINLKLQNGIIFKNKGEYIAGTTYQMLDVVRYNNKIYFCKVQSTTSLPTNRTDWGLLTPETIDLSPYATTEWVNQQLANYDTRTVADGKYVNLTGNQTINGNKEFQGDLSQKISGNTGTFKIKNSNNSVLVEIGKAVSNSGGCFITTDTSEINLRSYPGGNVVVDGRNNLFLSKAPTDNNHGTNKQYVDRQDTALSNRITNLENNYNQVREWSATETYQLGARTYHNDKFWISTQNNNIGHEPVEGSEFWKFLSLNVETDLTRYYTKTEADAKFIDTTEINAYLTKADAQQQYLPVNALNGYATEEWVNNHHFATQNELNNYVLTSTLTDNYWNKTQLPTKYVSLDTAQTVTGQKVMNNHFYAAQGNNQEFGIGTKFRLGSGGTTIYMTPDTNQDKVLQLFESGKGNLDLKFNNRANAIRGLANPTENDAAANKAYVDAKFAAAGGSGGNVNLENYARKDQNNTFTGNIISTSNNNNFISRNDGVSVFKVQTGDGTDLLHIGKTNSGNNQAYISSKLEHMTIEAANNKVLRLTGPAFITSDSTLRFETPTNKYAQFGTDIRFGFGASNIKFSSDDSNNKKISFGGNGGRGKLDIDLENNAKIINVPNPVADEDVANKAYVDEPDTKIYHCSRSTLAQHVYQNSYGSQYFNIMTDLNKYDFHVEFKNNCYWYIGNKSNNRVRDSGQTGPYFDVNFINNVSDPNYSKMNFSIWIGLGSTIPQHPNNELWISEMYIRIKKARRDVSWPRSFRASIISPDGFRGDLETFEFMDSSLTFKNAKDVEEL